MTATPMLDELRHRLETNGPYMNGRATICTLLKSEVEGLLAEVEALKPGTCPTCVHWIGNIPFTDEKRAEIERDWEMYKLQHVVMEDWIARITENAEWATCEMMEGPTFSERREGTRAVAEDGSGYRAGVYTHQTMGCPMHERRQ